MIAVILPLVKTAPRTRPNLLLALFGLGATLSAAVLGVLLALIAPAFQASLSAREALVAVGSVAVVLALADLGIRPLKTPMLRRQTQPWWFQRFGGPVAFSLWGLDLGLGFTTFRATSLYWLTLVCLVVVVTPSQIPLASGFYGVGLAVAVAVSYVWFRRGARNPLEPAHIMLAQALPVRRSAGVALAIVGVSLLVEAVRV
jgi:hypothetical protein